MAVPVSIPCEPAYCHLFQRAVNSWRGRPKCTELAGEPRFALLLFHREAGISGRIVWTMLASSITGALSTAFLQLPIHKKFNQDGYSERLMKRLLVTDGIRKVTDVVRFLATALLLRNLIWR
jgi:hypothetical protein